MIPSLQQILTEHYPLMPSCGCGQMAWQKDETIPLRDRLTNWRANWAAHVDEVWQHTHTTAIDAEHLAHQRAWSTRTFGPGARLAGVLDHIHKELAEVEAQPDDVTEWADVIILAFDGALRSGHEPQHIIDAIKAKQTKNEARTCPDWRTMPADKAIEHDRSEED